MIDDLIITFNSTESKYCYYVHLQQKKRGQLVWVGQRQFST